jgi:hypothetical protein
MTGDRGVLWLDWPVETDDWRLKTVTTPNFWRLGRPIELLTDKEI